MKLVLTEEEKFKLIFCIGILSFIGVLLYFVDANTGYRNQAALLFIPFSIVIAIIDLLICRNSTEKEEI